MAGVDKIFLPIMGQPLLSYSLKVFNDIPEISEIVLVLSSHNLENGRRLVEANGWNKVKDVCTGGDRRQDSVRAGLEKLPDLEWIVVHDGARPFIDSGLITTGLAQAEDTGAAIAAVPVKDTIKDVGADQVVARTIPRNSLWTVQTPQVFRRQLLAEAHRQVADEATDDASMVEKIGGKVRIFSGSYHNIKVTTPEDITLAEAILTAQTSDRLLDT